MSEKEPDWKAIALYLADCHAAVFERHARGSTHKQIRAHSRDICAKASELIKGDTHVYRESSISPVMVRLKRVADEPVR